MAKILEEVIVIKLSRMVKDSYKSDNVVSDEQRKLIEDTIPALVEEVINDTNVVVEVAELN